MQDLTPVGLSEDGTRLVLVSSAGEEFSVPVDTRLRAALRGDNARHGRLETKMDSALRPRDIQARIRAGESPEDVAAAAQTTVDAIMPFAAPVVAERQHVARNALKGSLRRRTGDSSSAARTLGEAAELYFSERSLHDEDVEWDAWRRPDGRWALVASYAVDGRPRTAEFTHDLPGRYVVADNDEARMLTGEVRAPGGSPTTTSAPSRRLSPVPNQDELPLGDDAIELVRDRAVEDAPDGPADPADVVDPTAETADADWLAEPAPDDVPLIEEPVQEAGQEPVQEPVQEPAQEPVQETVEEPAAESTSPGKTTEPPAAEDVGAAATEKPAAKRKGRSSVPSWDEIMFGGSAKED